MGTSSDSQRMAKWADKTETIANQINEAKEQVGRIIDKATFILTQPPPTAAIPEDVEKKLEDLSESPDVYGTADDSALNRKLDGLIAYLQGLNDQLGALCDRIDI